MRNSSRRLLAVAALAGVFSMGIDEQMRRALGLQFAETGGGGAAAGAAGSAAKAGAGEDKGATKGEGEGGEGEKKKKTADQEAGEKAGEEAAKIEAKVAARVEAALAKKAAEEAKAKAKDDEAKKKADGDIQGLYASEQARAKELETENQRLKQEVKFRTVDLRTRDFLAENYPEYAGVAEWITPHVPFEVDTDDDAIDEAIESAVKRYVKANPRAAAAAGSTTGTPAASRGKSATGEAPKPKTRSTADDADEKRPMPAYMRRM